MTRVGLIGEDPYDKESMKNLLKQRYANVTFKPILRGVRGGGLDSPKTLRAIKDELVDATYDLIVFIRDLDGLPSQHSLIQEKEKWFKELKHKKKDILLLNIWELETLIFGDIETFNKNYGVSLKCSGDPMMISKPKEVLKSKTFNAKKIYQESDCPELFSKLDINKVEKKCRFFREFLSEFDKQVKA